MRRFLVACIGSAMCILPISAAETTEQPPRVEKYSIAVIYRCPDPEVAHDAYLYAWMYGIDTGIEASLEKQQCVDELRSVSAELIAVCSVFEWKCAELKIKDGSTGILFPPFFE